MPFYLRPLPIAMAWAAITAASVCQAQTWRTNLPVFSTANYSEFSVVDIQNDKAWINLDNRKVPKHVMLALPQVIRDYFKESDAASLEFTFLDLNHDGVAEMLISHPVYWGSGGRNFILLQERTKNTWKMIGEFAGGPVFMLPITQSRRTYYRVVSNWRFGVDVVQTIYHHNGAKYRLTTEIDVPRSLTQSCGWYAYWQQLNLYKPWDSERNCCGCKS
jgi:hypothetical protein